MGCRRAKNYGHAENTNLHRTKCQEKNYRRKINVTELRYGCVSRGGEVEAMELSICLYLQADVTRFRYLHAVWPYEQLLLPGSINTRISTWHGKDSIYRQFCCQKISLVYEIKFKCMHTFIPWELCVYILFYLRRKTLIESTCFYAYLIEDKFIYCKMINLLLLLLLLYYYMLYNTYWY